jgi:superfamily II DNA or RNA helicase
MFCALPKEKLQQFQDMYKMFDDEIVLKFFTYNEFILLPRYSVKHMPFEHIKEVTGRKIEFKDVDIEFTKELKPKQKLAVESFSNKFKKSGNVSGLLIAGCGFGKTATSIYIATQLKKQIIIIADQTFLIKQWKDEILKFTNLKENDIGLIGDNHFQIDRPIVISTVQSILSKMKNLKEAVDMFSSFGVVIYDEAHSTASSIKFALTSIVFSTNNIIGITATPNLENPLNRLLFLSTFDEVIHTDKKYNLIPKVIFVKFDSRISLTKKRILTSDPIKRPLLYCQNIVKSNEYVDLITKINNIVLNEPDRFIVNVVSTVNGASSQGQIFKKSLSHFSPVCFFGSNNKMNKNTDRCVIGSYKKINKAFDHPKLTDIVITYPIKTAVGLEQLIGRTLRDTFEKPEPRIWFLIDTACDGFYLENIPVIKRTCNEIFSASNANVEFLEINIK